VPGTVEVKVHEPVAVPSADILRLEGHEAVRPDCDATVRVTAPDKPKRLDRVRELFPDDPAVNEAEDADMP
jgi:hypothetical protein